MAVPPNTFQTYQTIGLREDLADEVNDISPENTPAYSNFKKDTGTGIQHDWQDEALPTATHAGAIEGDDADAVQVEPTRRFGNMQQIIEEAITISGTNEAVEAAGRGSEVRHQTERYMRLVKNRCEVSVCRTDAAVLGDSATAREMAGLGTWLAENVVDIGGGGVTPPLTGGVPTTDPTAGTPGAFTEAHLRDAIGQAWDNGGYPTLVLAGRTNKEVMSTFTGKAQAQRETGNRPGVIIGAMEVFVSDFGDHFMVASHFMPADNVYVLDPDQATIVTLRNRDWGIERLGKTGDNIKSQILGEKTLKVNAPRAHAKIYTTL